jgi:hypothetical protein
VNLGDGDNEVTNPQFRMACAQAIAALVNEDFGQAPVIGVREWWRQKGRSKYNRLAM